MRSLIKENLNILTFFFLALFHPQFSYAQEIPTVPPVCRGSDVLCEKLNRWYQEGTGAGNLGDQYDNRDRGHAHLNLKRYPQMRKHIYSPSEEYLYLDWGSQLRLIDGIVIGNASTAAPVKEGGSNPRRTYYGDPKGLNFLYQQYRGNNIYVYPSARDHTLPVKDQKTNGDLYPTNTPYVVISQGASSSDLPFVETLVQSLAAMHPDVKEELARKGLIAPTLQALLRKNYNSNSREDYLSGKAHPTVFDIDKLNREQVVQDAHDLTLQTVPPLALIQEINKPLLLTNSEAFQEREDKIIGDTPAVIARQLYNPKQSIHMTVSAAKSFSLSGKPLKYHWVLLRGEPDRVKITPSADGTFADIDVKFHPPFKVKDGTDIRSTRVDIGVFADDGTSLSAPAFVTVYSLPIKR